MTAPAVLALDIGGTKLAAGVVDGRGRALSFLVTPTPAGAGPGPVLDVVIAFSTSGRSANVVHGVAEARRRGAATGYFGGSGGGPAAEHADHVLVVDSSVTARVQEMHLLLLHLLSEQVDRWAAGES